MDDVLTEPALPRGWRRWSTDHLEDLLAGLDDSTDAWEMVLTEIQMRGAAAADHRVAQALGCAPSDEPS